MAEQTLDVVDIIDKSPLGSLQKVVIGLCACLVFLDGFDAQAIGYVAPALIQAWHIPRGQMGPVFSAGLIGLMLGAVLIAPLADRFGRRPVILASTFSFGVFTLLTAAAPSIGVLWLLRFLTGLGLGGCMPNTIALTSEYAPERRRALLVMLMFTGFTLGSLCAGLVSAQLISRYGWQAVFIAGGVLPVLVVLPLLFALPESIRFLVTKGGPREQIARLVRGIDSSIPVDESYSFHARAEATGRVSAALLFAAGRGRNTLLLWTIFFMSLLDIYLLVNWLPTAINAGGASMESAILVGAMLQVGGLVGPLPLGWLLDRSGARVAMVPAYLLAAACIACVGIFATTSLPLTMLVVFGAGFGVLGGQTAANAVAASIYPTSVRATGVGWALGLGRVGSIVGPALAGVLISRNVSLQNVFLLSAIPALGAALASAGLVTRPAAIRVAKAAKSCSA
jgi:MFS transporter, AAHS family, 4-hydroxybenzoate transporter